MKTSYKDVQSTVVALADKYSMGATGVNEDSLLSDFDSIDAVEFTFAIESEFNIVIPDATWGACRTVRDYARYVATVTGIKDVPVPPT